MALVFAELIGPNGERLAEQAASAAGAAVGLDPEGGATFDSDDHSEEELKAAIVAALEEADPEWQSHLTIDE